MNDTLQPRPTSPTDILAVGVCTYKRLAYLSRCLTHIAQAAMDVASTVHLIVVDNDGSDPQVRDTVLRFAATAPHLTVHFEVEKKPGIAAARNAVFGKAFEVGASRLAMLDDDEWPDRRWLTELLKVQASTSAAVVGGPVRPEFPASAKHLEKHARFWSVQEQTLHGKPFVFCSCNFLIDLVAIAQEPRPLFDDSFGLSGGEDTVFFRQLFFKGHPMAWAPHAWMYEEVPESRANLKWMRQRRFGIGNHAVRWEQPGGKGKVVLKTLGLMFRLTFYPLLRREPETPWLGWLLEWDKVRGRVYAHMGKTHLGYARPDGTAAKACR